VTKAHFRLFGVPIRVEPFFVIVALLLGFHLEPLWVVFAWVAIVFVSVLLHEMAHAMTYRALGQRSAIVLHAFGGFTIPTGGGRRVLSKPASIAVSVSGAFAQLLLLWLPARQLMKTGWALDDLVHFSFNGGFSWWIVLYYVAYVNLWWAIFNLLPIRPLDGGHVIETLVGFENACKFSIVFGVGAGIFALREFRGSYMAGLFMFLFAFMNYRDLKADRSESFEVEAPEGGGSPPGGRAAPGRSPGGRAGTKRRRSGHLQGLPSTFDPASELSLTRDSAEVENSVWNALRTGDADRAAALLKQSGIRPNAFLQASVALAQGHAGLAGDMFEAAYLADPGGPPNLVPATLLADRGQAVELATALVAAGDKGIEAAGSLQTHLHYADRFRAAAEVGEQAFAAGPPSPAQTAFEVACSWARADRADEALRWVESAVDAGFKAPGLLDSEPDLASVRALPGWTAVRSRLSA
jgi:Zn-dependent protease